MEKYLLVQYQKKKIWVLKKSNKFYPLLNSISSNKIITSKRTVSSKEFKILPPFLGRNAFGLAYNYKSLLPNKKKYDEPLVFIKSSTSIIGDGDKIIIPDFIKKIWIEGELAIIISKKGKNISPKNAKNHILGYTCSNDVTAKNVCGRDHHLARSKSLDTFAPIGQYLVKNINTNDLEIVSKINNKLIQRKSTNDRVLNTEESISLVSKFFTLRPGDIIFTGTPAFNKPPFIKKGDKVTIKIEKIGTLKNIVK